MAEHTSVDTDKNLSGKIRRYSLLLLIVAVALGHGARSAASWRATPWAGRPSGTPFPP